MDLHEALGRFKQHLADNNLSLREMSYRLGPKLTFDSQSESFAGVATANAFLSRSTVRPSLCPTNSESACRLHLLVGWEIENETAKS